MPNIFNKRVIANNLQVQDESLIAKRWASFQNFLSKVDDIRYFKEEEYQDGFLRDIFESCLGYTLKTTNPKSYNLSREKKNETDSKKADGAIWLDDNVIGIIELKAQDTRDLDKKPSKDKLSPIDQSFGYLVSNSSARYVIISNFDELRFYIDKKTSYEKFKLFSLTYDDFKKLHLLLSYESISTNLPLELKEQSNRFEQNISKELYRDFSEFRLHLFNNLILNNTLDKLLLLRLTQKLCDRIIFILFAEDRGLLRENSIKEIRDEFSNQKFTDFRLYDIYKFYFDAINKGNEKLQIPKYNGGLFAKDEILDTLIIDDNILDKEVQKLSDYDFASDVSVNILGHIFEQSLTDLEELEATIDNIEFDKKQTKRKKDGVFYTPEYITKYIVDNTLGKLCQDKRVELKISEVFAPKNSKKLNKKEQEIKDNLEKYKDWLFNLKILDPACGSGAFLNQALEYLIIEHKKLQDDLLLMGDLFAIYIVEESVLENNLYGVDINEDAVEIAKLSLWLRTAKKGRVLTRLADKIKCGNSLMDDKSVVDNAFVWKEEFLEVFANGGFDVVIGNPPYIDSESMTKTYREERKWIAKNYKTAKGNWDIFIPFVELGLNLLKDSKYLSFIIPNKILSAKYGIELRKYINKNYSLTEIFDLSINNVFDIDVYPVIIILEKIKQVPIIKISYQNNENIISRTFNYEYENNWALYLDNNYNLYTKVFNKYEPLNENIKYNLYSSASVSEAYEVKEFIEDNILLPTNHLKLINTGTIDPYVSLWGFSSMTYIKDNYKYPIIDISKIKAKIWTQQAKISFAGMAIRIEAFIDTDGIFLPLKSTTVLTSSSNNNLLFIGSLLNSKLITFIFKIANSANTMAGGYLNVNKDNLGMLPIPKIDDTLEEPFIQKANQMIELNKNLQIVKQNFINELELEKIPKKLQNFENLTFEEFIKEYKKAKKLKFKDKLEERNFKNDWLALFENDSKIALELKFQIDTTDKEIDKMVYELYGLSDDEILIVEGG